MNVLFSSDYTIAPQTLDEVFSAYHSVTSSVLVAGGRGLSHRDEHYDLAINLSNTGLNYIRDNDDEVIIGAMTPLMTLGKYPFFQSLGGGIISKYIKEMPEVEWRQYGTVGGVLASKGPFSVLLPILLCLTTDVELHDKGRMSMEDYLYCPPMKEVITQLSVAKERVFVSYEALRVSPTDEPYLTGAVSLRDDSWRIVVGGRPGLVAIAENASELLSEKGMAVRENVARVVSEEMEFGNFGTCSERERREYTVKMIRDLINKTWKGYSRLMSDNNKK